MLGKNNPCSRMRPRFRPGTPRSPAGTARSRRLLPVRPHHADTGQRFLRHGADVGELRLDPLEPRVDGRAEVPHGDRHERQRNQRDQRQPRIDRQHQRDGRDEEDDGVRRVHDGRPDHHAHGVQIVGRPRHQVARAVRLEVRQRKPLQRREEVVPQVVSISREIPMMMRRMRNRNTPPARAMASSSRRIDAELAPGDARRQVVDRVLQHPRGDKRHAGRHDDRGKPEGELAPVAEQIGQETTARRAHPGKVSQTRWLI